MSQRFLSISILITLFSLGLTSLHTYAARPMTENDLGNVSAETGGNILNLLGAPAAGLRIDSSDDDTLLEQTDTYKEGETTEIFAIQEIKSLEKSGSDQSTEPSAQDVDISAFEEAIYASKQTIRTADSLDFSNSELRYFDKNVQHDLTIISNKIITVTRDLQIDRLQVDKLNTSEDGPSAGSVFLSDWRSQGTTKIQSKN